MSSAPGQHTHVAARQANLRAATVSVVIPTLNESQNLARVFARIPADVHEVILVDGHSVDDTVEVARRLRPDIKIVMQNRRGKGNALACGFAACTGDIVVMIDADGSTDPAEIPDFVAALTAGADFAKGTRFADGGGSDDITRIRRAGNRVLNGIVNTIFDTRFTDLCYGYNAFWTRHLRVLELDTTSPAPEGADGRLWGDGFEIETLINVRVAVAGLRISEVPSFERSRVYGVSNLNAVSDGLRVLRTILVERRRARYGRGRRGQPAAAAQRQQVIGLRDAPRDSDPGRAFGELVLDEQSA